MDAAAKALQIINSEDTEYHWQLKILLQFLLVRYSRVVGVKDPHIYKNLQTLQEKLHEDLAELDEYRRTYAHSRSGS